MRRLTIEIYTRIPNLDHLIHNDSKNMVIEAIHAINLRERHGDL